MSKALELLSMINESAAVSRAYRTARLNSTNPQLLKRMADEVRLKDKDALVTTAGNSVTVKSALGKTLDPILKKFYYAPIQESMNIDESLVLSISDLKLLLANFKYLRDKKLVSKETYDQFLATVESELDRDTAVAVKEMMYNTCPRSMYNMQTLDPLVDIFVESLEELNTILEDM